MKWPQFVIDWVERRSKKWGDSPKIKYAYVEGQMRWEKMGGEEDKYFWSFGDRLLKDLDSATIQTLNPNLGITTEWGPTHIQYKSKYGFMLTKDPWCFHFWLRFRKQEQNPDGSRIPGTEFVIYRRLGEGRWAAGESKVGQGHYEKPTAYINFSTHYD